MRFIDFFSGIGGFTRGMQLAGHECVGHCEIDRFAEASYRSMHLITDEQRDRLLGMSLRERQIEILKEEYLNGEWYADDIGRVYAGDIPESDCWCFGFPCQDISIAGKQLGFKGNRSGLFFRVMYLVGQLEDEKKPEWLFIENVKNLLSVNRGWDFARLLSAMDENGYDAEWEVLNSKDFGVPQNRERVFIIGHLRGRGRREVFPLGKDDSEASKLQGQSDDICVLANSLLSGDRNANGVYPIVGGGGTQSKRVSQEVVHMNYKRIAKRNVDTAKTLCARDYKGFGTGFDTMNGVIVHEQGGTDRTDIRHGE